MLKFLLATALCFTAHGRRRLPDSGEYLRARVAIHSLPPANLTPTQLGEASKQFNKNYLTGIKYLLDKEVKNIDSAIEQMTPQLEKSKLKLYLKAGLYVASILFNEKPKRGIAYLMATGHRNMKDIAKILGDMKRIDKKALGEYFGGVEQKNQQILKAYVDNMPFVGKSLVDALRDLCKEFLIPGEAQKIDRVMDALATSYDKQNPGIYRDTTFSMLFSMMILNSDLHNPNVKNKNRMKRGDYIKNTRHVVPKRKYPNVTDQLLKEMYNSIKENELTLH